MIFHPGAHFQIRAHIHAAYRTAASAWDLPSATKTSIERSLQTNMSSKKLKRFLSVALSLSMVFSMNVTSFAADADIPAAPDAIVEDAAQEPAADEAPAAEDTTTEPTEDEVPAAEDTAAEPAEDEANGGDTTPADDAGQTDGQPPADTEEPTTPTDPPSTCEHDWKSTTVLKQANCKTEETGIELVTCSKCQNTDYRILPFAHTAGESTVTKAPTCVEEGIKSITCSICGTSYTESINATGKHDVEEKITPATCQSPKKIEQVCRTCKTTISSKTEGEAAEHTYKVVETTPATCVDKGSKRLECSVCKATKTEEIPALGGNHNEVEIPAVAPTCSKKGMTAGKKCSVCGTITVQPTESSDPQPAHQEASIPDVAATCKAPGSTGGKQCTVCGTITEEPTEIPKDETKHVWGDDFTILKPPANCTDTGIGLYTCTLCGESAYQTLTDSHDWDEGTVTKAATCGTAGEKTFHCKKCDETKTETIPATEKHNFIEGRSEATCTQPAKVGMVCSVCKKADGEAKPVEGSVPLGHKWDDGKVTTPPSCNTAGEKTFTCTNKGCDGGTDGKPATKTESVAATHDWEEVPGSVKAPTCTEEGSRTLRCKNPECPDKSGETAITKTETTPALGHAYIEKTIPATCYHATRVGMICKRCDTPQSGDGNWVEYGKKLAHVYKVTNKVEATCTTDGSITKTCENCPETFEGTTVEGHTTTETIKAGHDWNSWVTDTEATCTTTGTKHRTCKKCYNADTAPQTGYEEETIPATHTYDNGKVTQAQTCGDDEITLYTCTKCTEGTEGHTKEETTKKATGEHTYDDIVVPATCTAAMQVGELCTVCKQAKPGSEVATIGTPLGHDFVTEYIPPTCTENGKSDITCSRCDYHSTISFDNVDSEQATHHAGTTEEVEAVPATCTAKGTAAGTWCTACETMITGGTEIPIDEDNHKFEVKNVLLEATCTEDGAAKYECSLCHNAVKFDIIEKGHTWDEDHCVTKAATCVADGSKTYTCTKCTAEDNTKVVVIKSEGHKYDKGVVTTPATCGKAGVTTFTCTVCTPDTEGHSYTETIPATNKHSFQDKAIPATCTEPAKAGSFCTVCNMENPEVPAQNVGKALGHDLEITYIPPTCTTAGISREACKRCDYKEDKSLGNLPGEEAKGHGDSEDVEAVPATCKKTGLTAGTRCSVCKEKLTGMEETPVDPDNHVFEVVTTLAPATCTTDGAGKLKCTLCDKEEYGVIKASHTWDEEHPVIVAATCVKDGSKTFHCTNCDEGEKTETIPATKHKYDNGAVTTPATCSKAGVKTFTCTNAGCTADTNGHSYTEPIPATNKHDFQEGVLDATCTEPKKVGNFCTVCKQPNGDLQTVGTALGHDLDVEFIDATCEEGAKSKETCKRCDYSTTKDLSNLVPAKGHKSVAVEEVPATCTKTGTTSGTKCSVCNQTLTGMTEIAINPDAHEYELVRYLTEPTCTTPGIGKFECACGASKFEEVAADPENGHNFVDGVCQNNCGKKAAAATTSASAGIIDGANKVTFENNIQVVDQDANVVEMGILYITAEGYNGTPETDLTIGSASSDVRKKSTTETGTGFRFSLKVGANVTRKLYARGYITITDKAGKSQTYYGDVISGSYNDFSR